jgi:hypothetical protein
VYVYVGGDLRKSKVTDVLERGQPCGRLRNYHDFLIADHLVTCESI